jgi:MoxR-like ATPase
MSKKEKDVQQQCRDFRKMFDSLRDEIGKVIVGYEAIVEDVLICLFCGGHVLLEGVPGLGKTLLVRTLSDVFSLEFRRIQFTPDLMPADIIGTNIVMEDAATGKRQFQYQPGPIFGQIILADEVNRATPKTQSAMLEAMQEHSVTSGGQIRKLPEQSSTERQRARIPGPKMSPVPSRSRRLKIW